MFKNTLRTSSELMRSVQAKEWDQRETILGTDFSVAGYPWRV